MLESVDRIVCINLATRKDRFQKANNRFQAVGLRNVDFFSAQPHKRGSLYGCFDSHRTCIQKAYDDGLSNLLIFEDDVKFMDGWEGVFVDAEHFLQSFDEDEDDNNDISSDCFYDALFLGGQIVYVQEKTTSSIQKAKCVMAHAYIVSRRGMKSFLDNVPLIEQRIDKSAGFDVTIMSVWQNMFCHKESNIIAQDYLLGTDNYWISGIPKEYVPWFQTVIVPKYFQLSGPLVQLKWWRTSYLGRHYVWGINNEVIDDGKVFLKGLWLLDTVIITLIMLCSVPPLGYLALARDLPRMVACSVLDRLKGVVQSIFL